MEPSDAPKPKMKLKINKTAAKSSASAAPPPAAAVLLASTNPNLIERSIGVLRGGIAMHDTHCSNRGKRQQNGRCCEELAHGASLCVLTKKFGPEPTSLKFYEEKGNVEVGFLPQQYASFLAPLLEANQLNSSCLFITVDNPPTSEAPPAFTMEIKVVPDSLRRSIASADYLQHWTFLAKAIGKNDAEDLLK